MVLNAFVNVTMDNPFSVYGRNYVEISSKYNGGLDEYF